MIKIIIITALTTLSLYANNVYDLQTITKDFQEKKLSKYYRDNIPIISTQNALEKYVNKTSSNAMPFTPDKCSESIPNLKTTQTYKCPSGIIGYSTSLYSVDFKSESMMCMVGATGDLEKPLALFRWTLNDWGHNQSGCKNFFEKDIKTAKSTYATLISETEKDFAGIKEQMDKYRIANDQIGANTDIPHLLAGAILSDTTMINADASIAANKIVLEEGFIPKGSFVKTLKVSQTKASSATFKEVWDVKADEVGGTMGWLGNIFTKVSNTLDNAVGGLIGNETLKNTDEIVTKKVEQYQFQAGDKASEILTSRMVSFLPFYTKFSMLSQDFYMLMLVLFGLGGVVFVGGAKIAKKIDSLQDHDGSTSYITSLFGIAIVFLPFSVADVTIDGKDMKLSQNNFNKFETSGYYIAMDFANGISDIIVDTEINSIIRRAGMVGSENIIEAAAGVEVVNRQMSAIEGMWDECRKSYNMDYVGNYRTNATSKFPISEQWIAANYIKNRGNDLKFYSTVDKGGLLNDDLKGEYPPLSLSACYKLEQKNNYLYSMLNKYNNILEVASGHALNTNGKSISKEQIKQLEMLVGAQKNISDQWGFMGLIGLPTMVYKTESIGTLLKKDEASDSQKQLDDRVGEMNLKSMLTDIPYFFIPGIKSIYDIGKDSGAAMGKFGGAVGELIGSVVGGGFGYYFALTTAKNLMQQLPIIAIILFGLLMLVKIFSKMFLYHIISPFVMLFAFSRRNLDLVKNYVGRIITVMMEFPLFVISIYAAMAARDLILSIGTPLSSTVLNLMLDIQDSQEESGFSFDGNFIHIAGNYLFVGITEVGLHIFAFVIIYQILTSFHTQVYEAMEVKSAAAMDNAMNSIKTESHNWGGKF